MTELIKVEGELFPLGQVVMTQGVAWMVEQGFNPAPYLIRHARGDWGDLCKDDKAENDYALDKELRIFSSYIIPGGKLWIITEADRSATTFLLPEEY